ncbi:hypothetical protein NQ315_009833 [Exocentrus adspersus]|uniref:Ribosome-binding factor A, mitochondrial n=1 Tax=Exocentrus adspersus TaxID=1586481 RepID=A0AAV8WHQ0_9CUCU|nr:hypothetical protein NQ315_009833 [Exocentrus adspersus]
MECLLTKTTPLYLTIRSTAFHTSCPLRAGWRQCGAAMRKVMGGTQKKKFYFDDAPKMPSPQLFSKGVNEGQHSGDSRRAKVLNKLFMRHITDQLGSGSCAPEILGYGVEINRVKISPDYKCLNVYWIAKGTADDEIVEAILERNAWLLRHELSQLRLMGAVPTIKFVKDKHYAAIADLDNRLSIADFGEDHVPLNPADRIKSEFQISTTLSDIIKEKIKQLDEAEDVEELPLPPMPQNVLGLNHADIMERINKCKKKSEARHRLSDCSTDEEPKPENSWVTFKLTQSMNENPVELGSAHSQRAAFKEFLHKRELLRMKARQQKKNYIPDVEYIKEELSLRYEENLSKFDVTESFEQDFIEEEETSRY